MSNTDFKKAFDNVAPDMYMETRILANIKDKKSKKHFPLKAVISGAVALALAAGCFGGIQYKTAYTDRPFSVMVVDASDDEVIAKEICEDAISLPHLQLLYNEEDSSVSESNDNEISFSVSGDDIDFVQYKSESGYFYYFDEAKMLYDQENRDFYSIVIPVTDEEAEEITGWINGHNVNVETGALKEYMKTHDLSKYFGNNTVNLEDYWVYFEKCADTIGYENENGYAFFLIEEERGIEYYKIDTDSNELMVKNYDISEETRNKYYRDEAVLMSIAYSPQNAVSALLDNPDINKSELPGDKITITVTFKDGKRAKKIITVSFDDEGYAQFALKQN